MNRNSRHRIRQGVALVGKPVGRIKPDNNKELTGVTFFCRDNKAAAFGE